MECTGIRGDIYKLDDEIMAAGGEGYIYRVIGKDNIVAKIYREGQYNINEKKEKIQAMVNKKLSDSQLEHITWPLDALYNQGKFVGYVMPIVKHTNSLVTLYADYKYNLKYRLLCAINLCIAIKSIHSAGLICGDLNPQNICVNLNMDDMKNGFKVTLVDTDSYHFVTEEKIYRCGVGMSDYLAPEIQKKVVGDVTLKNAPLPTYTQETDLFALAVHIFCLLMNGCHPFACAKEIDGAITNTMEQLNNEYNIDSVAAPQPIENIRDGFFPFYEKRENITIPAYAPEFSALPDSVQKLFIRTFVDGYDNPLNRVKPDEWIDELKPLINRMSVCEKGHYYFDSSYKCPLCRVDEKLEKIIKDLDIPEIVGEDEEIQDEKQSKGKIITGVIGKAIAIIGLLLIIAALIEMRRVIVSGISDIINIKTNKVNLYQDEESDLLLAEDTTKKVSFDKCGVKFNLPENSLHPYEHREELYGSTWNLDVTNQLALSIKDIDNYYGIYDEYELPIEDMSNEISDEYIKVFRDRIQDEETELEEIGKIKLGNYYYIKIKYKDKEYDRYECDYIGVNKTVAYEFSTYSYDTEISENCIKESEEVISTFQINHIPVQINLKDNNGNKLELPDEGHWDLYVSNTGEIDEETDDSIYVTVWDDETTTSKVVLPSGHYSARLVHEIFNDENSEYEKIEAYDTSFDIPDSQDEINIDVNIDYK